MGSGFRVDALASERHFLDHLSPVWRALPPEVRGTFHAREHLVAHARSRGVEAAGHEKTSLLERILTKDSGPVLVASYRDYAHARRANRTVVYAEHGAGQSYAGAVGRHTSYAGGAGREGVCLLLVPGDHPAERNRAAYPRIRQAVIGCPKLDAWHLRRFTRTDKPVVAVSFHWDCTVCPETRSAWSHYRGVLGQLATDARWEVLGHGHPRILEQLRPEYARHGVEVAEDFDTVLERADLYCCDNSSSMFEFASTDRPVVVLNCPLYRRSVKHGLRFWECADVGVQVDQPGELSEAIALALEDHPEQRNARRRAVARVYKHTDGRAAERAAAAILEVTVQLSQPEQPEKPPFRMRALKPFVTHEGHLSKGDPVYPGWRRENGKLVKVNWVTPEHRRRWLLNRELAVDWPEEEALAQEAV